MKKLIYAILVFMLLAFAGCNKDDNNPLTNNPVNPVLIFNSNNPVSIDSAIYFKVYFQLSDDVRIDSNNVYYINYKINATTCLRFALTDVDYKNQTFERHFEGQSTNGIIQDTLVNRNNLVFRWIEIVPCINPQAHIYITDLNIYRK